MPGHSPAVPVSTPRAGFCGATTAHPPKSPASASESATYAASAARSTRWPNVSPRRSATPTSLNDIYGIGALTAAEILAEIGEPARFATKDRFAMANGTAPIEASSGRVVRRRLNRGGNRQLNRAIHTAAITQISRPGSEGRACYQRCLDRGKNKREAIRYLKRRI